MPKQKDHQLNLLAEQELSLQAQEAREAKAEWYYTRTLARIGLPASRFVDNEFSRDCGRYHLVVQAPRAFGVPYGIYPRGIFTWLVTEIVNRKNLPKSEGRKLILGSSLASDFSTLRPAKSA
jgi:hypothetical protein